MAKRKGHSRQHRERKVKDPVQQVSPWGVRLVKGQRIRITKDGSTASRSRQMRDPFQPFYTLSKVIPPPVDPVVLMDLAEDNPVHGACLSAKAIDTAGRGWSWSAPEGQEVDGKVVKDLNDTLARIAGDYTWDELLTQAAWERESVGYAAWEITRDEAGTVAAIYPLPAWSIRATRDANLWVQESMGRLVYFKVFGAIEEPVDPETGEVKPGLSPEDQASEILIFRGYSSRTPWYGVPTWWSGTGPIAELTAIREFNVSYFKSGGQGDFNIHVVADDGDVARALADEIEEQLNQSQGVQHTKLVTSGTKDVAVSTTPITPTTGREGHFRLRRGDLVTEVLMAHQVPPYRVGWAVLGGLGGSASTDMLNAYRYGAIKPAQRILQHKLATSLFGPNGLDVQGYTFQLADLTLDDLQAEQTLAKDGITYGMLTPNEGRAQLRLSAVDDDRMNQRYMSSALVPLGTVPQPAAFTAPPRMDQLADAADRLVRAGWDPTDVAVAMGLPAMKRALPVGPAATPGGPTVDVTALVSYLESAVQVAMEGPALVEKSAPRPDPAAAALALRLEAAEERQRDLAEELIRLAERQEPVLVQRAAPAPVTDIRVQRDAAGRIERTSGYRADGSLAWVRDVERNPDGTVAGMVESQA